MCKNDRGKKQQKRSLKGALLKLHLPILLSPSPNLRPHVIFKNANLYKNCKYSVRIYALRGQQLSIQPLFVISDVKSA